MKIKFNDSDNIYDITSFRQIGSNLMILKGPDLPSKNTSGFQTVQDDGTVLMDYSVFTTKYNIITPAEGVLMLSNNAEYVETEDNPASGYIYIPSDDEIQEDVDPLNNEELTECVADLMYEVSMMALGL